MDYSIYLSQPFFFVLFQILILLTTVYSIGSELKFGSAGEWLEMARGNILTAVAENCCPIPSSSRPSVSWQTMYCSARYISPSLAVCG